MSAPPERTVVIPLENERFFRAKIHPECGRIPQNRADFPKSTIKIKKVEDGDERHSSNTLPPFYLSYMQSALLYLSRVIGVDQMSND